MKQLALLLAGFALYSATLRAQSSSGVPESHRPPPGMCRIWIDGVPPTHQPAPTDCATAIRKRPMNARVVFGSDASTGSGRGVAPAPRVQSSFAPQNTPAPTSAPSQEAQDRNVQQQRDEQERQRIEAQRQREEQQKREAGHAPPPQTQHDPERAAPQRRPRTEKAQRPPQQSHSRRRPR
jgi:hypothetical protein